MLTHNELKPCPFCGGEPRYINRKCNVAAHAVGCSNNLCIIWLPEDAKLRELNYYASCYVKKEDMIEAWNRRII